jgi:alpha-beta hydrolase superfamily lysophospholipase
MDLPGFGLSEGLHGYIPSFDDLVDDAIEFYTKVKGMTFDHCCNLCENKYFCYH